MSPYSTGAVERLDRPPLLYSPHGLEWWFACYSTWFGTFLLPITASMDVPSLVYARYLAPEWVWGGFFVLAGVQHVIGLAATVARPGALWPPFMRLVALAWTGCCFLAFGYSVAIVEPQVVWVATYIGLVGGVVYCVFRAARDARHAWEAHRASARAI